MQQLTAWLNAHGVHMGYFATLAVGFAIRHWGPQLRRYMTTTGVDVVIMKLLVDMNGLLKKAGATDDEIRQVTLTVSQIALRAGQDLQKSASTPTAPK